MDKKISPIIRLKIIALSKCFWYWNDFFIFYSSILGVSKRKLELKFPKESYNKYSVTEIILDELDENNKTDKIKEIISCFYKLDKPFDKDKNGKYAEAVIELKDFKSIVGKDPIEEEIKRKLFNKEIKLQKNEDSIEKEKRKKLEEIKETFYKKSQANTLREKQERGYWLEKGFYKLLELENIEHYNPYKTTTEQIDGLFKFKSFDYLVEIKWTDSPILQKDISIFEGKLSTKGQSTRGFILSISGFNESAILAATKKNPRIIFMDVSELITILEGSHSFYDVFLTKESNLVKFGKIYK